MKILHVSLAAFIGGVIFFAVAFLLPVSGAYSQAETPTETPTEAPTATPTFTVTPTITPTPIAMPFEPIRTASGLYPWVEFQGIREMGTNSFSDRQVMGTHPVTGELYWLTRATRFDDDGTYSLQIVNPTTFQMQQKIKTLAFHDNGINEVINNPFSLNVLPNGDFLVGGSTFRGNEAILEVSREDDTNRVIRHANRESSQRDFFVILPEDNLKGFPEEGMLFVKNSQLVLFNDSSEQPLVDLPVPEDFHAIGNTQIFRGPDQQLYLAYETVLIHEANFSYVFRIEEDRSLTNLLGRFNFYHRFNIGDITYNQSDNHFYFTDSRSRELFRANPTFSSILQIALPNRNILSFDELEYSENGDILWLRGVGQRPRTGEQFNTIYKVEINTSNPPTPTSTPTPFHRSSTFRPTPIVDTEVDRLTVLESSFSINLLTNASVETFSVIPGREEMMYTKTESQRVSFFGSNQFDNFLRIYGPVRYSQNATPQNRIPLWGQFQVPTGRGTLGLELISLPDNKHLFINNDQNVFRLTQDQQSRLSNQAIQLEIKPSGGVYIGEGHSFMNVESGKALLYEFQDGINLFFAFDPSQEDLRLEELVALQTIAAFSHFHWGPAGMLHAVLKNPVTREFGLFRFMEDGMEEIINDIPFPNLIDIDYVPVDDSFYFLESNTKSFILYRLPNEFGDPQPVLMFPNVTNSSILPSLEVSNDGTTLFFNTEESLYSLRTNTEPGVPIATPTPTGGMPTPTPTPMDWIIMDGFGGLHTSRTVVDRPLLPYFAPFDIARDLEPDPLGRGWYMLDGFGGIHPSSPELPLPSAGLPFLFGFDFAVNLEIVVVEGDYNFIILDRFGAVHKVGPDSNDIQVDAPWFGANPLARDLELAETKDAWMVMDGHGVLYDTRDFSLKLATDAFWHNQLLAKGLSVLPGGERIMIDAYGGIHADKKQTFVKLHSFANTPYIPGFDIFWDIEVISN